MKSASRLTEGNTDVSETSLRSPACTPKSRMPSQAPFVEKPGPVGAPRDPTASLTIVDTDTLTGAAEFCARPKVPCLRM